MTGLNLPHSDSHSHTIATKNLEQALFKLGHSGALSAIVWEWLAGLDLVGPEDKDHLMSVCFIQIDLMKDIQAYLPEL